MAGLTIDDGKGRQPMWTSDRRLYLDRDGNVTDDAEAASGGRLLVGKGGELPAYEAERLGLTGATAEKAQRATTNKARKPEGDK